MTEETNVNKLEKNLSSELSELADRMLGESLENGIESATEYAKTLVHAEENSGIALSKFLHGINAHWKEFETEGETFPQWAIRSTGLQLATCQRRLCIWEFLTGDHIPKAHRRKIKEFSIRQLSKCYSLSVKQVLNQNGNYDFIPTDYDISDEKWMALTQCPDENSVIALVREITDKTPNSNRTSFRVKDGNLIFYKGKKEGVVLGSLNVRSIDSLVQEGIERVMELLNAKEIEEY